MFPCCADWPSADNSPGSKLLPPGGTDRAALRTFLSFQNLENCPVGARTAGVVGATLPSGRTMMPQSADADVRLSVIRDKVEAGRRLSFDDGVFLYEQADLCTLGELANLVRERKNGNRAYYN